MRGGGGRKGVVLAAWIVGVLVPAAAAAQVLEINSGGGVTVYDGPAVYTAQGVVSIQAARSQPRRRAARASPDLDAAARDARLSAALVEAVAWQESHMRAGLVSRAGAVGEMQLMPSTAKALGVDPRVTRQNYAGGAAYLRSLLKRYDGDLIKTLAAYNAGPEAVDRYGGMPPFKETQDYVAAILEHLSQQALADDGLETIR